MCEGGAGSEIQWHGGLCGKSFMAPDLRHTGFPDLFGVLFGQRVGSGVCGRGPASQGLAGDGSR